MMYQVTIVQGNLTTRVLLAEESNALKTIDWAISNNCGVHVSILSTGATANVIRSNEEENRSFAIWKLVKKQYGIKLYGIKL